MRYYFISRSWMVSRRAQWIYRRAAWCSIGLMFLFLAMPFLEGISGPLLSLYRLALYTGALGTAITMVAMEYFLFGFDTSSTTSKVFWFLVMWLPPLGPAIYCLVVYARSAILEKKSAVPLEGMAEEFRGSR